MADKYSRNSSKMRKQDNYRKYSGQSASEILQYYVSQDVKAKKNALKHGYNSPSDKDKGIKWFNEGLTLEDAPLELQNNVSFIAGFNYAKRIKLVNDTLYNTGMEYFDRGILLENSPINYRNNEYFIAGYNDRMNNRCK